MSIQMTGKTCDRCSGKLQLWNKWFYRCRDCCL